MRREPRTTAEAAALKLEAARCRIEAEERGAPYREILSREAERLEESAGGALGVPAAAPVVGGELAPDPAEGGDPLHADLAHRLRCESRVALEASGERLDLLEAAGVLAGGADLARDLGATGGLARLIAHGAAACHHHAMLALADGRRESEAEQAARTPEVRELHGKAAARHYGAASRLFRVVQDAGTVIDRVPARVVVDARGAGKVAVAGKVERGK